jgi:microcystin-dependent protein
MDNFNIQEAIEQSGAVAPYLTVGSIISSISTSIPSGWLLCDGSEYSKTGTYANLYSKIGIRYGETNGSGGVGSTHFKLPDLRSKHLMSHSSGASASGGGSHSHTVNANATASSVAVSHNHTVNQAGYGGVGISHAHSGGDSYVGPNGSNPVNANKTGTGGSGYGAGGAHVHDGYSYMYSDSPYSESYHGLFNLGINSHTAGTHSHTSASSISGNSSGVSFAVPAYTVNFLIKV